MRNVTLQTLRDWDACSKGYAKIAKHVRENEVIDLYLALLVTSIPDVVWVLSHDPDTHRWLSFLADMIDLPGCEVIVQAVRDYRDGKVYPTDLESVVTDALITVTPRVTATNRNTATVYAASHAAARAALTDVSTTRAAVITTHAAAYAAAYAARAAISIGGLLRINKLIKGYYQ